MLKSLGSSSGDLGSSSDSTRYQLFDLGPSTSPEPQLPLLSVGANNSTCLLGLLEANRTEKCQVRTSLFPEVFT